jgi:hypothetical protein
MIILTRGNAKFRGSRHHGCRRIVDPGRRSVASAQQLQRRRHRREQAAVGSSRRVTRMAHARRPFVCVQKIWLRGGKTPFHVFIVHLATRHNKGTIRLTWQAIELNIPATPVYRGTSAAQS